MPVGVRLSSELGRQGLHGENSNAMLVGHRKQPASYLTRTRAAAGAVVAFVDNDQPGAAETNAHKVLDRAKGGLWG